MTRSIRRSLPAERSLQRFFLPPGSISGSDVLFPSEVGHQILHVFRLNSGDRVIVLDNSGNEYVVQLETERPELEGRVLSSRQNEAEPAVRLHLYQGLLKGRKMELILQKCTEIGMTSLTPMLCERSVPDNLSREKAARARAIVREAAEQSGRGRLPTIEPPISLTEALRDATGTKVLLVAPVGHETGQHKLLRLSSTSELSRDIDLFVGPEGGFTEKEIALARAMGAERLSLGKRTLRAETAAIVGTALVLAAAESGDAAY